MSDRRKSRKDNWTS